MKKSTIFSLMLAVLVLISSSGCVLHSRSISRARGPITPPPQKEVVITDSGGSFSQIAPVPEKYRYGKFFNDSNRVSFQIEMTPEFQVCMDCRPDVRPTPENIWKTIEQLTLSINSISPWFRCPADRVHHLRFSYVEGRRQYTDRLYLDPVFTSTGTMCGGAHADWCQWFDR